MKAKISVWIALLLFILPLINAQGTNYTLQEIIDATLLEARPSGNNTVDSSRFERNAENNGGNFYVTSVKKVGSASASFNGTVASPIKFLSDDTLSTYQNFTVCAWTNWSKTAEDYFITTSTLSDKSWVLDFDYPNSLILWRLKSAGGWYFIADGSVSMLNPSWQLICGVVNFTTGIVYGYLILNKTVISGGSGAASPFSNSDNFVIGGYGSTLYDGGIDQVVLINLSLTTSEIETHIWNNGTGQELSIGTSPPEITFYNLTSEGGLGCTNWNTDKNNPCTTSDTTPTVAISTNKNSNCAIGRSNLNYTDMGGSRNCTGLGTKKLTCTLIAQDEISAGTNSIYIGCQDTLGNENLTSTSNALKVTILNDENTVRNSIETGIQLALTSGYTIYTNQRVYARNSANQQRVTVFDKVVKWMNKIWAFNGLTGNETSVAMLNITPVLYTLELNDTNATRVNSTVYNFIINTK